MGETKWGVRRTAFYWAKDPKVRREVDACRRRALNQAIGRLTGMAMNAVEGIAHLAQEADSESVQLRAWRSVLADLMSVSKFSVLEYRMTEIEEELGRRDKVARWPGDPGAPEILRGQFICPCPGAWPMWTPACRLGCKIKYGIDLRPEPACSRTISRIPPVKPPVYPSANAIFYLTLWPAAAIFQPGRGAAAPVPRSPRLEEAAMTFDLPHRRVVGLRGELIVPTGRRDYPTFAHAH